MQAPIPLTVELFTGLGLIVTVGGAWSHLAILLDRIHQTLPGLRARVSVLEGKVDQLEKTVSTRPAGA